MLEPRFSRESEGNVFASPDDSHYMALTCFMNGSLAREAVRDRYGLDWPAFNQALAASEPGNGGRLMLPYFAPEIVPAAGGGVVRRGLGEDDPAGNVRAVIEAQAMSSRVHSRWMHIDTSSLHITGGASVNEEIAKIYANVHGCPVRRGQTTNAAALGAALKAFRGHRPELTWPSIVEPFCEPEGPTIQPDPSVRSMYDDLIGRYVELETIR